MAEEPKAEAGAPEPEVPPDLSQIGVYPRERDAFERGIVVLCMGRDFWLVPTEGGWGLLVEPVIEAAARRQIATFEKENLDWPPKPPPAPVQVRRMDFITPFLWVLTVVLVFREQAAKPGFWEDFGALDTVALFDRGELWRPATALFLHADVGHITSNLISGFFVFAALLAGFGRVRGWLLLTLSSLVANLCVAALHYPGPYRSLGASTAIFAALGLLTGAAMRGLGKKGQAQRWRTLFGPLVAGLGLLSLYGSGGLRTDLGAHLFGFVAGLATGYFGRPGAKKQPRSG